VGVCVGTHVLPPIIIAKGALWRQAMKPFVADYAQYLQPMASEQTKIDAAIQRRGSWAHVPIGYKKGEARLSCTVTAPYKPGCLPLWKISVQQAYFFIRGLYKSRNQGEHGLDRC